MILRRIFARQSFHCRKYIITEASYYGSVIKCNNFHSLTRSVTKDGTFNNLFARNTYSVISVLSIAHRKCYCKGLLDGDTSKLLEKQRENELQKISELFPQPRVTLNILQSKMPDKMFDIYYKQNTVAPKGKKKGAKNLDWTCTYSFVLPEKMKFESTAISKRQAAEKAATQALHYLYINKRIDSKGNPIHDKEVLNDIRSTLNEPLHISISDNSVARVERIWSEYENGIKKLYEKTFEEAKQGELSLQAALTKDSTLDEEDHEFSDRDRNLDEEDDLSELKTPVHPVYGRVVKEPSEVTFQKRDRVLKRKFELYDEQLTELPIDSYADDITSTIESNRVTILVGAAGCGKSTRAPAAILRKLRAKTTAVVSEPRRVAAIGLAQRVAAELGEDVGESIGYQVRLQSKPPKPPCGSILYCTSGVLLRRLQTNPGLIGCTHVFIDEAHERDVNTDLAALLLRRALTLNNELRVIIMSATLDTGVFTRYFDSCPVIEVPGRTFPVEVMYLDEIQKKFKLQLPSTMENCRMEDGKPHVNCQEIAEVIKSVDRHDPEGAILVFLPGWAEIKQTKMLLEAHYRDSSTHMILPVHSRLSTEDQTKMFSKPLPGIRKIVLATNIAETSITIPDVVYVIDSGAHKENRIKEGTGTASLETVWVSQAGARQRTGRAGRVQPGHCYRLYTKEKENEFASHSTPEILRVPLDSTVLQCKSYAPDEKIEDFLSELPEPPTKKAIKFAVDDLIDMGALTPSEQLTRLGLLLSSLSLPPRLSLSLLHAGVAGSALPLANVVTHCADNLQLFHNAQDAREEIREFKRQYNPRSDHCALHWIQNDFENALAEKGWRNVLEWCESKRLRRDKLGYVKSLSSLHLEQLLKSGLIEPTADLEELNRFSGIDELTAALLLSGSNTLLKTRRNIRTKGKLMTVVDLVTSTGDRAHIGTESVNYGITKKSPNRSQLLAYFGGSHSVERRALVVYLTSLIPPHTALLFCKGHVQKQIQSNAKYFRNSAIHVHILTIVDSQLLAYFGGSHSVERRALVVYLTSLIPAHTALLFCKGHVHKKIQSDDSGDTAILKMPRHRLEVHMPSSQADLMLKAKEMLWNTFQYYIERDVKNLEFDEYQTTSRFKVRLFKAICRILVEAEREFVQGKKLGDIKWDEE